MRPYIFLLFLTSFIWNESLAQQAMRKLHYNINQPSLNVSHPFISGDGETLLYLNDYTESGGLTMFWTQKNGTQWADGKEVNRLVNRPDMTLEGAFSLNYEGSQIIVTSRKSGLGGFELWYSDKQNGDWTGLKNFGAPINSSANEGAAVLTTDGLGMYFMRCEQMSERSAEGCKIYFASKKYGKWQQPELLPEQINKFNPQMPRIMADGETLIFSSKAAGGKGGFDLYQTRKIDGEWQEPVNLEFANTPADDQFVSIAAKGRYLYKAQKGDRKMEIVQLLFPDEYRPRQVYRVTGQVQDISGKPLIADLKVFETATRKRLINETTAADGTFSFVLIEGNNYDVSLEASNGQLSWFSKLYELDNIPSRDRESLNITLLPTELNKPEMNEKIKFEPFDPVVSGSSVFEVRRLAALLRSRPDMKVRIHNYLFDYQEDSIPSSEDLTEVRIDTIWQPLSSFVPSLHITTTIEDTVHIDSLQTNGLIKANENDTLYVLIEGDSIMMQNAEHTIEIPVREMVIETVYHNDRTLKEAEALKSMLIEYGVEAERIITEGEIQQNPMVEGQRRKLVEITFLPVN